MLSSLIGDLQISEMLLKAGADVNQRTEKHLWGLNRLDGYDPLFFSAEMGRSDIARLLIKSGADINRKYKNETKVVYEALAKGYIDYVIVLVENGLEIESDPQYMHYNAELAHIAADYYSSTNEKKALQLYKQAITFYPQGIKNYEIIADGKNLKAYGLAALAGVGAALNTTAIANLFNTIDNIDVDSEKYYRSKAKNSERNYNLCKTILNCYEENKPDITLVDCVKNAGGNYKKLEAKGGEELNGSA